ncbi:MAG TPA: CHAP domain-containing protein [Candidatus Saccharimonadales bacterium]|jgi:surface antigen
MTYVAILTLIVSVVSVGYQSPVEQQVAAQTGDGNVLQVNDPSVDQRIAADLAASTAETAGLAVASNVSNLSISLSAKAELSQSDSSVLTKPQIVQVSDLRGISTYTAVAGDTAQSVASKYGVSPDTVKWANNLSGDAIAVGAVLKIPNVDGVLYTVKDGDNVDSIASKYSTNRDRLVSYNDLELGGVTAGQQIVLPGGILPTNERPGYSAPGARSSGALARTVSAPVSSPTINNVGNRYDYGYCTWYAYNRRAELGRPIGSFWGNASTWASYARSSGFAVNGTPAVGAVLQNSWQAGGYGHVAVVESVNADGSILVSEMNYAGWNIKSTRTVSAGEASGYNYIH